MADDDLDPSEREHLADALDLFLRAALRTWDSRAMAGRGIDGLAYTALGMGNEAGEVLGTIKKLYRDDDGTLGTERRSQLSAELGDVLWYWVVTCHEAGLSPGRVALANVDKLTRRMRQGTIRGDGDER